MTLIDILKKLSELANSLDKKGFYAEANELDTIIKSSAYDDPWFQTQHVPKAPKGLTEEEDLEELKKAYETLSPDKKKYFLDKMEEALDKEYYSAGHSPPKYIEDFLREAFDELVENKNVNLFGISPEEIEYKN